MSSRCSCSPNEGVHAKFKGRTVVLVEQLPTNRSIWIVEDYETDELLLAYEYDLECYYYE